MAQVPGHAVQPGCAGTVERPHDRAGRVVDREARALVDRVGQPVVEPGAVGRIGGPEHSLPLGWNVVTVEEHRRRARRREDRLVDSGHRARYTVAFDVQVGRDQPDVVQDVDAAAVRPGDHVVVTRVDLDVVDGDGRYSRAEVAPRRAPVDRGEGAVLRAHDQYVRVGVVLAHHIDRRARQTARE